MASKVKLDRAPAYPLLLIEERQPKTLSVMSGKEIQARIEYFQQLKDQEQRLPAPLINRIKKYTAEIKTLRGEMNRRKREGYISVAAATDEVVGSTLQSQTDGRPDGATDTRPGQTDAAKSKPADEAADAVCSSHEHTTEGSPAAVSSNASAISELHPAAPSNLRAADHKSVPNPIIDVHDDDDYGVVSIRQGASPATDIPAAVAPRRVASSQPQGGVLSRFSAWLIGSGSSQG